MANMEIYSLHTKRSYRILNGLIAAVTVLKAIQISCTKSGKFKTLKTDNCLACKEANVKRYCRVFKTSCLVIYHGVCPTHIDSGYYVDQLSL